MTELAGFWIICLGIIIFIVGITDDGDFKDKVKMVIFIMTFFTLLCVGSVLLVGV